MKASDYGMTEADRRRMRSQFFGAACVGVGLLAGLVIVGWGIVVRIWEAMR
jgi:hypothetical protein